MVIKYVYIYIYIHIIYIYIQLFNIYILKCSEKVTENNSAFGFHGEKCCYTL